MISEVEGLYSDPFVTGGLIVLKFEVTCYTLIG